MRGAVIVGGGISGLSAAYELAKTGLTCTLVERRPRLGGVIRTDTVDGCVLEAGPDSFLAAKPWALALIRELGLGGDVIASNDHLRVTYVLKGGRLVALPDGLMLMVPTRIWPLVTTRLLGWPTKIRMGLEWLRRPPRTALADRSVAEFIRDHYGPEAVDYLAEPLLSGVYGGDPNRLSVGSVLTRFVELEAKYGSLTRGVLAARKQAARTGGSMPLFQTLKGGLGQLTDALARAAGERMEVLHGEAETIERRDSGYRLRVNGEWIETRNVVLACQAYEAAGAVTELAPELAGLLNGVEYSSSMTVALVYDKRELGHPLDGFGFLVPKRERRRLVACTWVGTKFSFRVPDHLAVLRCFLGGTDDSALGESDETIVAALEGELRDLMGVTARPRFHRISRWPRSMAQYTVGHAGRVARIQALMAGLPGLHLAGNAYYGIGIPDCVRMGRQAAQRIAQSDMLVQ
ncbi:MAG: protoporphyrinogen oxidase [Acidobacteria bacterium]|nr:protoporphyrinogen oxidase [Acidobacteriota bacterium]